MTEKLYRFTLAFDGEPQDLGIFQGFLFAGINFSVSEECYERFRGLPAPLLETPDDSPVEFWFREEGLLKFRDVLNEMIYELSCVNWQVLCQVIEQELDGALYVDKFQVAFAGSYLETDKSKYKEVGSIGEMEPYIHYFDRGGVWMDSSKEFSRTDVLKEVLSLAAAELNQNGSIGYTMPDGKHHIYIYVNDSIKYADSSKTVEDGYYVVEPNRVVDGAHEPMGDTASAEYDNFGELMVACSWCLDQFEEERELTSPRLTTLLYNSITRLEELGCEGAQLKEDIGITPDEYSAVMETDMEDYSLSFGTGYKVQSVYADKTVDGGYGDIYCSRAEAVKEHPGAEIMVGFCVIDEKTGLVPDGCKDWNETISEAVTDYEDLISRQYVQGQGKNVSLDEKIQAAVDKTAGKGDKSTPEISPEL